MPQRKRNRLQGFDYSSPNYYFVTVCTQNKEKILWEQGCNACVGDGFPVPKLSFSGQVVENTIAMVPARFPDVHIDKYVIMPNHLHMIVVLTPPSGTGDPSPTNLSDVMAWFKYQCTKLINQRSQSGGQRVFQRSYHDHIIRNEADYLRIWNYIDTNPATWEQDCFYTEE